MGNLRGVDGVQSILKADVLLVLIHRNRLGALDGIADWYIGNIVKIKRAQSFRLEFTGFPSINKAVMVIPAVQHKGVPA
jgi:hypothetical protein